MPRSITPKPLTRKNFSQFGNVIEVDNAKTKMINEGNTVRFHDLAELDLSENGGKPGISIFRSKPLPRPLILELMERHPLSSQTFYPLSNSPYLVVVAPPGKLEPTAICAFLAQPNQGVNYHKGTWHHYSLALDVISDFLVIDRISKDQNCNEIKLTEENKIKIDNIDV